eukprot:CAMPEP_0117430978 /NCGR_PEP_ID=MMETSP0758-20121206/10537_1 /TAXON_ID=63605 /ORGANISM="Percolomonas cosmopolitus, Strain AE-1 (ATCC 50343)" /LENGTH=593 /DNA_ID=CAMNT_0005219577 /DNA_START=2950 /DNA_END=4731 /DNA_ORIENTATION=-
MTIHLSDHSEVLTSRTTILKDIVSLRVHKFFSDLTDKDTLDKEQFAPLKGLPIDELLPKLRKLYFENDSMGELFTKLMKLICAYDRLSVLLYMSTMDDFPPNLVPHWHYHIMKENPSKNSFIKTVLSCIYIDPSNLEPLAHLMEKINEWNVHYQLCGSFESLYDVLLHIFSNIMDQIHAFAETIPSKFEFSACEREKLPKNLPLTTYDSTLQLFHFMSKLMYNENIKSKKVHGQSLEEHMEKSIKHILEDESMKENVKHVLLDIVQPLAPDCYERSSSKQDFLLNQFLSDYCTANNCTIDIDISKMTTLPEVEFFASEFERIQKSLVNQKVTNNVEFLIDLSSKLLSIYKETSIKSEEVIARFKPVLDSLFNGLLKSKKFDECVLLGRFKDYVDYDDALFIAYFEKLKLKKEVIVGCNMLLAASPKVYASFIVQEVISKSPVLKLCVRACKKHQSMVQFNLILLQLCALEEGAFIPLILESDIIKHLLNGSITFITYRHAVFMFCHMILYANAQFVINTKNSNSFWHYMHIVLELFSKCVHPSSRYQSLLSNQYGLLVDYLTELNEREQSILLQRTLIALVQILPPKIDSNIA